MFFKKNTNLNKNREFIFIISLVVLYLALSYRQILFGFSILTYGDWYYSTLDTLKLLRINYFTIWFGDSGLGRVLIDVGQAPTYAMYGLLANFGLGYEIGTRLIHFWPNIFFNFFGSYLLFKSYFKSKYAILTGVLVFSLNTYFLTTQTGHNTLSTAFSFFTISIYFYKKLLESSSKWLKYSLLSSLFFAIITFYEPRAFYVLALLLALYAFIFFVINLKLYKQFFLKNIITGTFFLLLNFFWLLPLVLTDAYSNNEIIGRSLFGNEYWTLINSLTLHHPWWNSINGPQTFISQPTPFYFWIVTIVVGLGVYFAYKDKSKNKNYTDILWFSVILLLGLFLSKQSDRPFIFAYAWLYENFPGFAAFREASKFYSIVAVSFAYFIGYFVESTNLYESKTFFKKTYQILGFLTVLIFLSNTIPFLIGTNIKLFQPRTSDSDYLIYNNFIMKEESKNYGRSLWVPVYSRWATYTLNQPTTSTINLKNLDSISISLDDNKHFESFESMVNLNYFEDVLREQSIKYVVLPIQDFANDDDFFIHYGGREDPNIRQEYKKLLDELNFLEKIDIGTKELIVYKNTNFDNYITIKNNIFNLENKQNLDLKSAFIKNEMKTNNFSFYSDLNSLNSYDNYSRYVLNPFDTVNSNNISEGKIKLDLKLPNTNNKIYKNLDKRNIFYSLNEGKLKIYSKVEKDLKEKEKDFNFENNELKTSLLDTDLDLENDYYLTINQSKIIELEESQDILLGNFDSIDSIQIYQKEQENLIKNPDFEDGLWQKEVGNCNNFDDNPIIGMRLNKDSYTSAGQSLELEAKRHIACSNKTFDLESEADYYLEFDYTSPNTNTAGFNLNLGQKEDIKINLSIGELNKWEKYNQIFSTSQNSKKGNLTLYSFGDEKNLNKVLYDSFKLYKIKNIQNINLPKIEEKNLYERLEFSNQDLGLTFSNSSYSFKNLITNGDFEDGLWQNKVGNCNNFDNRPILDMKIDRNQYTSGSQSLQLEAARHIACTSKTINIPGGNNLMFSFDFQSPNSDSVGYYLKFNDEENTTITQRVKNEKKGEWQNYTRNIKIPKGANSIDFVVYGYSKNEVENIITRYDNFQFIETPDFRDYYFIVSDPDEEVLERQLPTNTSFENTSSTKKNIKIEGATDPFFMNMSEGYHPDWKLLYDDSSVNTGLNSWIPLVRPSFQIDESLHFQNGYDLNTWYINPSEICQKVECEKNSDGSYNLNLVVEFWPQRWMNVGMVVSGITFIGLIIVLFYFQFKPKLINYLFFKTNPNQPQHPHQKPT